MYFTEIAEFSANCMHSAMNVFMMVNKLDATFDYFRHESTWIRQARNYNFISGK